MIIFLLEKPLKFEHKQLSSIFVIYFVTTNNVLTK